MKPISPRPISTTDSIEQIKPFLQRMFWRDAILAKAIVKAEHAMPGAKSIDFIANLIALCEIGQRVLDNWPVPLQGYHYRFSVMEDDEINAYALPTGFVFVNRGLLETTESDLEIEGVIAHEIAHVERRHSYRIYRNEQKKQAIAAGVGVLVGVIAGAKSNEDKMENAIIWGGLAAVLAKAATDVFFEGYPRSMEEEADAMAALYLERQYGREGLAEMTRVLKKLRYYLTARKAPAL